MTRTSRPTRSTRSAMKQNPNDDDCDKEEKQVAVAKAKAVVVKKTYNEEEASDVDESKDDTDIAAAAYVLDGVQYTTYMDFVAAKRKRNEDRMRALGFMDASTKFTTTKRNTAASSSANATKRGIKRTKTTDTPSRPTEIRKSSRLSGSKTQLISLDYYVNDWNRDSTTIVQEEGEGGDDSGKTEEEVMEKFFKDRVNDGSDLTLKQAIELNDAKWNRDNSVAQAQELMEEIKQSENSGTKSRSTSQSKKTSSPTSVISPVTDDNTIAAWFASKINGLSIDKEEWVAKVTPDRIYYVTTHPSESKLVCCAGDKQGYVGLWDVDTVSTNDNNHGVSLFRPHSRPISCLEWLNHDSMITASYDGSVRRLNVEKGIFEEIFATYDDSDSTYLEDLGDGLDQGSRYWTQYVMIDPRSVGTTNPCLFVSTSVGDVFHVDLRSSRKGMITFHESVSDKKINTVSLHPNGNTLATAGNDGVVRLFDIRRFGDNRARSKSKASPKPLCQQVAGLSVSSAFFSPSGKSLLTTSFANRLDLTEDAHLKSDGTTVKPSTSIRHNNQTGRWLTTFQAKWHPTLEIFCSGSMDKPRCMEVFDSRGKMIRAVTGESLSSVMSRTCFHPSCTNLVIVGGNSSGRVVAVR
ncbi:WD repeat-containing protein [Nitzschia inconspicua]|uniref:WD repeat-containing protein n=1 Tax=Nitzschia inconspicua TaxID=303405 RepID=A0A9K3Q2N0_9STRA|nr:WD repeat-containing protein [Nitzschia inconspicua]